MSEREIIKYLKNSIDEKGNYCYSLPVETTKAVIKELDRLNNIINELEKELREGSFDVYFCSTNTQKTFKSNEIIIKSLILDKLKKLKENK